MKKKDFYHHIFQEAPMAIFIANEEGEYLEVNEEACNITGYSREELIGMKIMDIIGPESIDNVSNSFVKVVAGEKVSIEVSGLTKKREKRVWSVSATKISENRFIGYHEDITSRKEAEQNYKNLFSAMQNGFAVHEIICDDDGIPSDYRFLSVNPAFERIMGLKADMILDRTVLELLPGTEHYWIEIFGKVALTGEPTSFQNYAAILEKHFEVTAFSPVKGQFACIFQDITERMQAEVELIVAKEKAEDANRLKTAFLHNLSHEIRTPMNAIIGFSELLNNPDIDEDSRKHFTDIISERGWQLTAIIDDIITISSLETRQERLRNDRIHINSLIGDQLSTFTRQANNKGILLTSEKLLLEEEALIYGDKTKLVQIFNNLIINALKFTEEGKIVIGCQKHDHKLRFYVRDTGIGIDKNKATMIFERFTQADDTISRDYGGTGLGLSICKGFVELMGGDIWVESLPEKGSTFQFTIPYKAVNGNTESIPSIPEIGEIEKEKTITVLVAEDEEANFLYLEALLENLFKTIKVRTIHAKNGQEAIDICREQPIDLVLMDIKMPVMNGYTATKNIRLFKPGLPVIAQTAYALKSELEEYGDEFDAYITKPFSMEKLRQVFSQFVKITE